MREECVPTFHEADAWHCSVRQGSLKKRED